MEVVVVPLDDVVGEVAFVVFVVEIKITNIELVGVVQSVLTCVDMDKVYEERSKGMNTPRHRCRLTITRLTQRIRIARGITFRRGHRHRS